MKGCVSVLYDIFPVQSRPKVFFQYQFLQSLIEGVVEVIANLVQCFVELFLFDPLLSQQNSAPSAGVYETTPGEEGAIS